MIVRYELRSPHPSAKLERYNLSADAAGHVTIEMLSGVAHRPLAQVVLALNNNEIIGWVAILHGDPKLDKLYIKAGAEPVSLVQGAQVLMDGINTIVGRVATNALVELSFNQCAGE